MIGQYGEPNEVPVKITTDRISAALALVIGALVGLLTMSLMYGAAGELKESDAEEVIGGG